jgi:two-component system response regulator
VSGAADVPVNRINILLVEPDPAARQRTLAALVQAGAHSSVVAVGDGGAALDYLHGRGPHSGRDTRKQPRLVIMDTELPGLDGLAVLKALRADPRTRAVPVVMLTATTERRTLDSCYASGANSVVRKTSDAAELQRKMSKVHDFWMYVNEGDRPSRV